MTSSLTDGRGLLATKLNVERDRTANLALCEVIEKPTKFVRVYFKAYSAGFLQKIIDAVTRGLSPLGQSGTETIEHLLDTRSEVRLSEAVTRPEDFLRVLTRLFGSGAQILESLIVDEIVAEFKLQQRPSSLAQAIEEAARKCEETEVHGHASPCPGYPPGLGMTWPVANPDNA